MTTLREVPSSKLGIKLQNYRADRPDEWTMDEFTREAEVMALRIKELEAALEVLLNAAIDYVNYKHDGDPYEEDARAMNEMELDDLNNNGTLDSIKALLKEQSK